MRCNLIPESTSILYGSRTYTKFIGDVGVVYECSGTECAKSQESAEFSQIAYIKIFGNITFDISVDVVREEQIERHSRVINAWITALQHKRIRSKGLIRLACFLE